MSNKWNFRILEQEYDGYPSKYILETDRGTNAEWFSLYRSEDLEEVRKVRKERETKSAMVKEARVIE